MQKIENKMTECVKSKVHESSECDSLGKLK